MLRASVNTCLFAACLISLSLPAAGQEIIHALTGSVAAINASAKTMTVLQDNGSSADFQFQANPKTRISFDKRIQAESTAADTFDKQGAYVIVFYYGGGESRTVVALKSLGVGPFSSSEGTVTKYDGHAHSLSIKDKSGTVQTFALDDKTIAEGNFGAVEGSKFHADKGDQVRVVSTTAGGAPTALFVRDL